MSEMSGWEREATEARRRAQEQATARAAGTEPLSAAQLAEWARLVEALPPGEWRHYQSGLASQDNLMYLVKLPDGRIVCEANGADMPRATIVKFIAAARTAVPALIGENARLRALLRQFLSDARQDEVTGGRLALLAEKVEEALR